MFKRTTTKESKIKDIVKFLKLLPEAQIDQVTEALLYGRISAVSATRLIEPTAQTTKIISNDEAPLETTATEQITSATKLKVESDVFRYFLQDDSKKGICSAQIKRICGNKAIWKRSLNGKKNQYVSGIDGMKSDEVDKVMSQFKNLETYFVKSPYKAKIWKRQI